MGLLQNELELIDNAAERKRKIIFNKMDMLERDWRIEQAQQEEKKKKKKKVKLK